MRKAWEINRQIGNTFPWIPHVVGRFYAPPNITTVSGGIVNPVNDTLYCSPFVVPQTTTYDSIAVENTSGTSGTIRMGIYNMGDGVPTSLVLDAGTVAGGAAGVKSITISQQLTRGWYWLAMVEGASTALFRGATGASVLPWLGHSEGATPGSINNGGYLGWSVASVGTGALADPIAGGGVLDGIHTTGAFPTIWLRVGSVP